MTVGRALAYPVSTNLSVTRSTSTQGKGIITQPDYCGWSKPRCRFVFDGLQIQVLRFKLALVTLMASIADSGREERRVVIYLT
jgi:hypothetical protein